ncbi:MAG TPA: hypothetical protein VEB19_00425, partial [Gemmatimonadaceae bacterium]|nr:hypothetical protein [Gemmatimonadaceae bacterium]
MKTAVLLAAFLGIALPLQAQSDYPRSAVDSALERARTLVNSGRDVDGRKLIDSVLKTQTVGEAGYAEVLYWRGALAATAA